MKKCMDTLIMVISKGNKSEEVHVKISRWRTKIFSKENLCKYGGLATCGN